MNDPIRHQLASRIRDLLLHEMGEHVDVHLLLGPPEYTRAVLSLCRACGSAELARLAEQFATLSPLSGPGRAPLALRPSPAIR
jgi:hypothetical protein